MEKLILHLRNKQLKKDLFLLLKSKHILRKIKIVLQVVHLLDYLLKKPKIVFCVGEKSQRINLLILKIHYLKF